MPTSTDEKDQNVKQEKNDGFLPTARHGKKDGGGGSREGGEVTETMPCGQGFKNFLNFRSTL